MTFLAATFMPPRAVVPLWQLVFLSPVLVPVRASPVSCERFLNSFPLLVLTGTLLRAIWLLGTDRVELELVDESVSSVQTPPLALHFAGAATAALLRLESQRSGSRSHTAGRAPYVPLSSSLHYDPGLRCERLGTQRSWFAGATWDKPLDPGLRAMDARVPIALVHEQDEERGACVFARYFDLAPDVLQQQPYKLFDLVAVSLYPGANHRKISLRHVMRDLGAEPVAEAHLFARLSRASTSSSSRSSGGGSVLSMGEWSRTGRGRLALLWGRGTSRTSSRRSRAKWGLACRPEHTVRSLLWHASTEAAFEMAVLAAAGLPRAAAALEAGHAHRVARSARSRTAGAVGEEPHRWGCRRASFGRTIKICVGKWASCGSG